jgi:glycosyltransferase involved in cell wall biosynthesis
LHSESSKDWGGQEIRIIRESRELIDRGYRMMVASQPESIIAKKAQEAGIPTFCLTMRKGWDFLAIAEAIRILKTKGVNIVHTHSPKDSWCFSIAAKCLGIPVVRSRHSSVPIRETFLAYLLYMKLADKIITSGSMIRDQMIERNRFLPQNIVSIPAGVDVEMFSPDVDGSCVRRELGIADGDFTVGIVSVLRRWKGYDYLIEAVRNLQDKIPCIKLIIVGTGPYRGNLDELIKSKHLEKRVIMTGYRDDVPQLMKNLDVLVLPSIGVEATSQVIPQALAMNVPVIATEAGGLGEVVIHEKTGIMVHKKDSHSLSQGILWVYRNYDAARNMAYRGRDLVLRHFTSTQMIDKTEEVYKELLSKN